MRNINVLGIDPGTTTLGCCKMEVDNLSRALVGYETHNISSPFEYTNTYLRDNVHGDLTPAERMRIILDAIFRALDTWVPDLIVIEEPFMNKRKPGAFKPLYQQVLAYQAELSAAYPDAINLLYSVQEIKSSIGVSGKKGKEPVYEGVLAHSELYPLLTSNHELLSEHEIDAIVIAYTGVRNYLR